MAGVLKKLIFLSDVQGNPQMDLHDKGVIDIGCSRYMTGNMSYLTDYEEIDGGYVAFGGNLKGGKITGKSTIKTGTADLPISQDPKSSHDDEFPNLQENEERRLMKIQKR
ncbi:hypothetical protein Tco_1392378 [Tanacetum coccineum]